MLREPEMLEEMGAGDWVEPECRGKSIIDESEWQTVLGRPGVGSCLLVV